MRYDQIVPGSFYLIAGRPRTGRVPQLEIVHVVAIEPAEPGCGDTQLQARFERLGIQDRSSGTVPLDRVLRRITDGLEVEKLQAAYALAGTLGDGFAAHAARWRRLLAAMDALDERGRFDRRLDRIYLVTETPGDVRAAELRLRARLAEIADGSAPATGDSERIARRGLAEVERRKRRRAAVTIEQVRERLVIDRVGRDPQARATNSPLLAEVATLGRAGGTLNLTDGTHVRVELISESQARLRLLDLPGAPFTHLISYVIAFNVEHWDYGLCGTCGQEIPGEPDGETCRDCVHRGR